MHSNAIYISLWEYVCTYTYVSTCVCTHTHRQAKMHAYIDADKTSCTTDILNFPFKNIKPEQKMAE